MNDYLPSLKLLGQIVLELFFSQEPYELSIALGARSYVKLLMSHICAVTYITEISLHVTLSDQSHPIHFHKVLETCVPTDRFFEGGIKRGQTRLLYPNILVRPSLSEMNTCRLYLVMSSSGQNKHKQSYGRHHKANLRWRITNFHSVGFP